MTHVTKHPPGNWCWLELVTTDPEAAKRFYGDLLGWEFHDTPAGEGMVFTFIRLHGDDVGALYAQPAAQRQQGVPVHWLGYVAVADSDAAAERTEALGGRVLAGPFDVGTAGRNAILADSQGAAFGVWQAREHVGAHRVEEPGAMAWRTLMTHDPAKAGEFYGGLFGWGWKESVTIPDYSEWTRGPEEGSGEGRKVHGGAMTLPEEWRHGTAHWIHYFQVEDPDATAARAEELGGTVPVPPTDIPGGGRFAYVTDPQGGAFAVLRL